jgi:hypothetical protein
LPFSELDMGVFGHLKLAPSQLNPNLLGFLRAFEFVCEHLEIPPTVHLFFRIFKLQRQPTKDGRQGWVSFKQQVKLFEMYIDFVRGFKERYYVIKPMTEAARESLYHMVEVTEDGVQVSRCRPRFPLAWSYEHFKKPTESYLIKDEKLTEEEKAGFTTLRAFVARFKHGPCVTREGMLKALGRATRKELLGNRILPCCSPFLTCLYFALLLLVSFCGTDLVAFLADNMADFAKEFLKHAEIPDTLCTMCDTML